MVSRIEENIQRVRETIASAAERCGRRAEDVLLVAVTKTRTVEEMAEAVRCGVGALGENRVQELLLKREAWPADLSAEWRLIGHLQRNKARKVLPAVDAVDSLDSLELARTLGRIAEESGRSLPVLLEVNTSGEASKEGVAPEGLFPLLEGVLAECPNLSPQGLMTIGPLEGGERAVRGAFALLRTLAEGARKEFSIPLKELSMGMSGDFEWAVEEGSTMVRVGTALFGARN